MNHITEEQFEEYLNSIDEPAYSKQYRRDGFSWVLKKSMPSFKYGLNIALNPGDFGSVNPTVEPNHSVSIKASDEVIIHSTRTLQDYGGIIAFLSKEWDLSSDALTGFNRAFTNDVLFIVIPRGVSVSAPIQIEYDVDTAPLISSIFVLAHPMARAKILLIKRSATEEKQYVSDDMRVYAMPGSHVTVVSMQDLNQQAFNVQKRTALCRRDSTVNWTDVCLGSNFTKADVVSLLSQEGADSNNSVLYLARKKEQYDIYTASIHRAAHTSSDIVTRGVLDDESKVLSRGLVRIEKNAFGSRGYETQDALLLSEKAEADAIPNLEINNHDVKCSHGSTVGQVDKEKLFYLMSRGLSRQEAVRVIVEGYFAPVIEAFREEKVKTYLHTYLHEAMFHD